MTHNGDKEYEFDIKDLLFDEALKLRSFSSTSTQGLDISLDDIGSSLTDILNKISNITYNPQLEIDITNHKVDSLSITTKDNSHYLLQVNHFNADTLQGYSIIFVNLSQYQWLNQLLKSSSEGLWDWMNVNEDMEWWSDQFYDLLGYTKHDISPTLTSFKNLLHPDDIQKTFNAVQAHFDDDKPFNIEYRLKTKSGDYRWFRAKASVRRDKHGNPTRMIGHINDIHEMKMAENSLIDSQTTLNDFADIIPCLLWMADTDKQYYFFNKAWFDYTGQTFEHEQGYGWADGVHPDDLDHCLSAFNTAFDKRKPFYIEYRLMTFTHQYRWVSCVGKPQYNHKGEFRGYCGASQDIHHNVQLAHYDPLTNLPNRHQLCTTLATQIKYAKENKHTLSLLYIDLDGFKRINDSYGQRTGDRYLEVMSSLLQKELRKNDFIARLGSDEFAIIIGNNENLAETIATAQRIRKLIKQPVTITNNSINMTASIGISVFPDGALTTNDLLNNSGIAMLAVKNNGGDNIRFYDKLLSKKHHRSITLEKLIPPAISNHDIGLYYQPQINTTTGIIMGVEALARWSTPELGIISPYEFIPAIENTGKIYALGEQIIHDAIKQLKQWYGEFPTICNQLTMSINISPLQLANEDFIGDLEQALNAHDMDPSNIILEITESTLMKSTHTIISNMKKLHDMGIAVSIDDFGTGYSSLQYLKEFTVSSLKIDQSFVRDITDNKNSLLITQAIIGLAHALHLDIIAEGVETIAQARRLLGLSCDQAQGYYFSTPLAANDMSRVLEQGCQHDKYIIA